MRNGYLNSADCINAVDRIDVSKLTFEDVRVHYGTGRSYTVQGNYEKKYFYRNGKKTNIGDIEESVWRDIVRQMISIHSEDELFQNLSAWYSETGGVFRTKSEQELYILELHAVRIFDDPGWCDYIRFNQRYRPDMIDEGRLVTVWMDCCQKEGLTTKELYEKRYGELLPCPHCGRYSTFHIVE